MDRPSQTHPYAGLLVYRSLRNVEFLLLNDSFTNKKHWFCPKGLVLGQEDELKCALRETFEATGLGPHLLRIEEGFKIQLRYLSGTKPKRVVYYLAQLVDNHARLLANAEGVHLQWCNQQVASEKVVFKSMQDVFQHAQSFIETKKTNNRNHHHHQHQQQQQQQQYNNVKRNISSGQSLKGNKMTGSTSRSRSQLGETSPIASATSTTVNNENQYNNNGMPLRQNQSRMMDRPSSAPTNRSSPSPPQPSLSSSHSVSGGVDHNINSNGNGNGNNNTNGPNPLFKTRLCERFETDGECPYGPRCTFAHGIQELRGRLNKDGHGTTGNHHSAATTVPSMVSPMDEDDHKENGTQFAKDTNENPLYKTKLCDRFMKDQFCQYGPKCHFAHGRSELKERPNNHHHHHYNQQQQHHHHQHQNQNQNQNHSTTEETAAPHSISTTTSEIASSSNSMTTTTTLPSQNDADRKNVMVKEDESKENEPRNMAHHLRRTPPASSKTDPTDDSTQTPSELLSPLPAPSELNLNGYKQQTSSRRSQSTQQKQLQAQPEHQTQHYVRPSPPPSQHGTQHHTLVNPTPTKKRLSSSDSDLVLNGDVMQTDKSWMKVVHLSKEEQVKLAMPPVTKTPSPTPSKVAQEEAIISELTAFFQSPESSTIAQQHQQHQRQHTTQHLLAKDVKQVTKVEMRNDLTKSQLFYILLSSLLQNSAECPVGTILRSREHLFKTFVKSTTDQRILLKAWDRCVQRYPLLLPKSTLVLSQWYECDLLDEEACYVWFDDLDSNGELKKKIVKFIDWLKTADEEDDD